MADFELQAPSWDAAVAARRQKQLTKPERKNGRPTGNRVRFEWRASNDSIAAESAGLGYFFRFNALLRVLLLVLCIVAIYPLVEDIRSRVEHSNRSPSKHYAFVVDLPPPNSINVAEFSQAVPAPAPKVNTTWSEYARAAQAMGGTAPNDSRCHKSSSISNAILAVSTGSVCSEDTASLACSNVCLVQPWCLLQGPPTCPSSNGTQPQPSTAMKYCPQSQTKDTFSALQSSRYFTPNDCRHLHMTADFTSAANASFIWTCGLGQNKKFTSQSWQDFLEHTCSCCGLGYSGNSDSWEAQTGAMLTSDTTEAHDEVLLPDGFPITWLVASLVYLVWLLYSQAVEHSSFARIDAKTITAADYSVWVTGLDRSNCDNAKLVELARHYGPVVAAFHVPLLGRPLSGCRQIQAADVSLQELAALERGVPCRVDGGGGCLRVFDAVCAWGVAKYLCMLRTPHAAVANQKDAIRRLEEHLLEEQSTAFQSSGCGIITFNYERHMKNLLRNQRMTKNVLVTSCAAHFRKDLLVARRAPLPRNVYWENGFGAGSVVVGRRFASWLIFACVLTACGFAQLQLFSRSQDELVRRINAAAEGGSQSYVSLLKSNVWAITQAIVVTLINFMGYHLSLWTTSLEHHLIASHHTRSYTVKLTLFYIINSVLLPLSPAVRHHRYLWYNVGGLVQSLFWIQVLDAFVPALSFLWDPLLIFLYFFTSRYARSQVFLDFCLEPAEFDLPYRYASVLKTLGLAVIFFPLLPVSPYIGLFALCFDWYVDRYKALRVDRKPKDLDASVRIAFAFICYGIGLIQVLMVKLVYFPKTYSKGLPVVLFVLSVAAWVLAFVGPFAWEFAKEQYRAVRMRFGHMPRGDHGRTKSFWETVGDASPALIYQANNQQGLVADEYTSNDPSDKRLLYYHDFYTPFPLEVPDVLTEEFRVRVQQHLRPFDDPMIPTTSLHDGQHPAYGHYATNNPGNTIDIYGAPKGIARDLIPRSDDPRLPMQPHDLHVRAVSAAAHPPRRPGDGGRAAALD